MNERPINFSAEMVRAILDGRKTQTRSVIKLREFRPCENVPGSDWYFRAKHGIWSDVSNARLLEKYCPWKIGERLWVRESIRKRILYPGEDQIGSTYLSDFSPVMGIGPEGSYLGRAIGWPWKRDVLPSIHMPRWASRINLEIMSLRAERLQDISEEDAIAEGVEHPFTEHDCQTVAGIVGTRPEDHGWKNYLWHGNFNHGEGNKQSRSWAHQSSNYASARDSYSSLWELLNAARGYGWNTNLWVFAIEFMRIEEQK